MARLRSTNCSAKLTKRGGAGEAVEEEPVAPPPDQTIGRRGSPSSHNETVTTTGSTGGRSLGAGFRVLRRDGRRGQMTSKPGSQGMTEAASHPLGARPGEANGGP
jgi:hypothetical protein